MTGEPSDFAALMGQAHRAMVALDVVADQSNARDAAGALTQGRLAISRLLEYRQTVKMTMAENAMVQNALDLLRARLRFFGEAV